MSSKPLPINSADNNRLDYLVKNAAVAASDGFVWLSREEGIAKDGKFRRTRFPKFMFEYPLGSKKDITVSPGQIMRMKTPEDVHFEASVIDIPDKLSLKDFGPKFYAGFLKQFGSDIQVVANKKITLECSTKAYRTDIKWVWKNHFQLTSLVVSAYKDNKCVYLVTHPMNPEKYVSIVESLKFE